MDKGKRTFAEKVLKGLGVYTAIYMLLYIIWGVVEFGQPFLAVQPADPVSDLLAILRDVPILVLAIWVILRQRPSSMDR